jgi:hypothetical protein
MDREREDGWFASLGSTTASNEPSRTRRQSFREVVSRAIISSGLDFCCYHGHDNSLSHDKVWFPGFSVRTRRVLRRAQFSRTSSQIFSASTTGGDADLVGLQVVLGVSPAGDSYPEVGQCLQIHSTWT